MNRTSRTVLKLFLVTYEIHNGESEYVSYHVTKAPTAKAAEKRALDYAKHFWVFGETRRDEEDLRVFWSPDECEYIEYCGVDEMAADEIIRRLML